MKNIPNLAPRALDEKGAAAYCGVSVSYLRRCRYQGVEDGRTPGPAFRRFGAKVRYLRDELDRWLEALPKYDGGVGG